MSEDIYKPPQADLTAESAEDHTLASRWARLGASLVDSVIIMAVTVPVMLVTGGFAAAMEGEQPSFIYSIAIAVLGLTIFLLVNGKFLIRDGQTLGKKLLGIKIVDLEGALPTLKGHYLKRYAVFFLPAQVPYVGGVFSVVNVLFIFGKEKRCIHDRVAGTRVVDA